jgi:hypothetical protein
VKGTERNLDRDDEASVIFYLEVGRTESAVLSVRETASGLKCGVLVLFDHSLFLYLLVQA